MTEPAVKLYAASFFAWHDENGQPTVRINPGIVLAHDEEEALREGLGGAFAAFPESEGWTGHQVAITELPQGLKVGSYEVNWNLVKLGP